MIKKFCDKLDVHAHSQFQEWRRNNPNGFFLTSKNNIFFYLHHVDCHHIGDKEWEIEDYGQSLTRKEKLCSSDKEELTWWARENGITIQECSHCIKNGLATDLASRNLSAKLESHLSNLDLTKSISRETLENIDLLFNIELDAARLRTPIERRQRIANVSGKPRRVMVETTVFLRNPDVAVEVLERAAGKCESCGSDAPFRRASNGEAYLEVHHIVRLADGGDDTVENALALCPNCHRESHYG